MSTRLQLFDEAVDQLLSNLQVREQNCRQQLEDCTTEKDKINGEHENLKMKFEEVRKQKEGKKTVTVCLNFFVTLSLSLELDNFLPLIFFFLFCVWGGALKRVVIMQITTF